MVPDRVSHIDEDIKKLQDLGILIDCDEEGYLLQIFTKPVKTALHCFLKLSKDMERRVSGPVISKLYLKL
jgi:4-hydroxyphenylpyruvate dioxygenase